MIKEGLARVPKATEFEQNVEHYRICSRVETPIRRGFERLGPSCGPVIAALWQASTQGLQWSTL